MVPSDTKNQSDQNKTFRDVLGGLWVLGRMFGHEFHALLIFQKFLIQDDFAALFGSGPLKYIGKRHVLPKWEHPPNPPVCVIVCDIVCVFVCVRCLCIHTRELLSGGAILYTLLSTW